MYLAEDVSTLQSAVAALTQIRLDRVGSIPHHHKLWTNKTADTARSPHVLLGGSLQALRSSGDISGVMSC